MCELKEQFLFCLIGAVSCAVATVFFTCIHTSWYAAILFTLGTAILTVFAFRFSESYQTAKLIIENPILNVGMASIAEEGAKKIAKISVNVVVSGFGILMDKKPYKFGHGGINLTTIAIDRESITLSFGNDEKTYSVHLLHGITNKSKVDDLTERLRYETGVIAEISGW